MCHSYGKDIFKIIYFELINIPQQSVSVIIMFSVFSSQGRVVEVLVWSAHVSGLLWPLLPRPPFEPPPPLTLPSVYPRRLGTSTYRRHEASALDCRGGGEEGKS